MFAKNTTCPHFSGNTNELKIGGAKIANMEFPSPINPGQPAPQCGKQSNLIIKIIYG